MNAEDFSKRVEHLTPSKATLVKHFSDDLANKIIAGYTCLKKNNSCTHNDPVFQICECYEHYAMLSQISFDTTITKEDDYYIWGQLDVDLLITLKKTGEIALYSAAAGWEITYKVAENSERFLDAYIILLEVEDELNAEGESKDIWIEKQINRCTDAAGGEKYKSFFEFYYNSFTN